MKYLECPYCGNTDITKGFLKRDDGYVCRLCGKYCYNEKNTDEKKLQEYSRCNIGTEFLKTYHFEEAEAAFEGVLSDFPSSVEARWGILLSRYGVIFVKGIFEGEIEPIYCITGYSRGVHVFLSEKLYTEIMELLAGDAERMSIYSKQGKMIDESLSYECDSENDVYICVKVSRATESEPHAPGVTEDYKKASDICRALRERGARVFLRDIGSENKFGADMEIWQNILRSKKMLVIGSRAEYLMSARVKSEWQRWLYLDRTEPSRANGENLYLYLDGKDMGYADIPIGLRRYYKNIYSEINREALLCSLYGEKACDGIPRAKLTYADGRAQEIPFDENTVCEGRKDIVSAELPSGLVGIAGGAFSGCSGLKRISLPESVISIGAGAFSSCTALTEALLGGAEYIGDFAFSGCAFLETVVIPKRVKEIGIFAFSGCRILRGLEIPASAERIGEGAFSGCEKLGIRYLGTRKSWEALYGGEANVAFPNDKIDETSKDGRIIYTDGREEALPYGKTSVEAGEYRMRNDIAEIVLPESVVSVGNGAFERCASLARIELSPRISSIGKNAFSWCVKLEEIRIPTGVTAVSDSAFSGCTSLVRAELPEGTVSVGAFAFSNCKKLSDVSFPDTLREIGQSAFEFCTALAQVKLPKGMEKLGKFAFSRCACLTDVYIPSGITEVSEKAFERCFSAKIVFEGSESMWRGVCKDKTPVTFMSSDGRIVYKNGYVKPLPFGLKEIKAREYAGQKNIVSVKLPDGVESVGAEAFSGCESLKKAELSDSLEKIGAKAFSGCTALTSAALPESVKSVGAFAFAYCTLLESIRFGANVKALGDGAFAFCVNLACADIPEAVTELGDGVFEHCTSLKKVNIPKNVKSIPKNTFTYCAKLESVKIPEGTAEICEGAFAYCVRLSSVGFAENLKRIRAKAFYRCEALERIELPEGVTEIYENAFSFCRSLKTLVLPGTLAVIDGEFSGCPVLTAEYRGNSEAWEKLYHGSVNTVCLFNGGAVFTSSGGMESIPYGTYSIEGNAYNSRKDIVKAVLPASVKNIGAKAFFACGNIRSVSVPVSVAVIGDNAFYGCAKLEITYAGTREQWRAIDKGSICGDPVCVICSDGKIVAAREV